MEIIDYLEKNIINLDCTSKNKNQVIRNLIDLVAQKTSNILNPEALFEQVITKESIESSGVGHQIAIIHARGNSVKGVVVTMAICKEGIDFGAKDNKDAKLLFLVVASEKKNREYLTILAKISRIFRNSELTQKILEAKNHKEILKIIKSWYS